MIRAPPHCVRGILKISGEYVCQQVWRVVASGVDKLIFAGISLETQCLVMVGRKGFMLIGLIRLLLFKHGFWGLKFSF
jgi:hypothetical protein